MTFWLAAEVHTKADPDLAFTALIASGALSIISVGANEE
jgi:hypothetical protein